MRKHFNYRKIIFLLLFFLVLISLFFYSVKRVTTWSEVSIAGTPELSPDVPTAETPELSSEVSIAGTPQLNINIIYSFEDKHFKRVLATFKNTSSINYRKKTFKQGNIPICLLVTTLWGDHYWEYQLRHISSNECPWKCNYTRDRNQSSKVDAILIHLESFKDQKSIIKYLRKRDLETPWVALAFESPDRGTPPNVNYEDYNFFFNRTMTYRKDTDIIFNHGFVVSKKDAELLPYHWRVSGENESHDAYDPNKPVIAAMITHCNAKSGRLKYARELQKHIKVDVYGACGTLKCGSSMNGLKQYKAYSDECLRKIGTSYLFYLAFENSFCNDYGTEKIYNLLYYPIVPIVYGGMNYEEILPPRSYINAADYSPSKLADYINFLVSDRNEYNTYMKWKEYYVPSTVGGERVLCDLCTRLNDEEFYGHNIVQNFKKWYVTDAKCFKYSRDLRIVKLFHIIPIILLASAIFLPIMLCKVYIFRYGYS